MTSIQLLFDKNLIAIVFVESLKKRHPEPTQMIFVKLINEWKEPTKRM